MKYYNNGCTRLVFVIGGYAIKIPNFTVCHQHFLNGCYNNWSERQYCIMFRNMPEFYGLVAPCYFCSWFGIISVYRSCDVNIEPLNEEQLSKFRNVCKGDIKAQNFGYLNGKMVCLDYP